MKALKIALAVLAVPLGVMAFRLLHDDLHQTEIRSLPAVVIGWTAIATGLLAWWQRPANRMGLLMTLFGFAVLIRPWQYSEEPSISRSDSCWGASASRCSAMSRSPTRLGGSSTARS